MERIAMGDVAQNPNWTGIFPRNDRSKRGSGPGTWLRILESSLSSHHLKANPCLLISCFSPLQGTHLVSASGPHRSCESHVSSLQHGQLLGMAAPTRHASLSN